MREYTAATDTADIRVEARTADDVHHAAPAFDGVWYRLAPEPDDATSRRGEPVERDDLC